MRVESAVAALGSQGGRDFEEFFNTEFPRAVAYCLALGLARPTAEDVAQEAFLTVLRRWETITNPSAYLRKVASRLAFRLPSELPRDDLATGQAPARADTSPLEERHVVLEALRQLPSQQQAVFALFFDDQPIPNIAEALDMPPATVRSHLRHARRRLGRGGDGDTSAAATTWRNKRHAQRS